MSTATTSTSLLNSVLQATTGSNSSGIDVTSAVNAVITAERAPETAWKNQQSTIANKTSAINQLQTESSTLSDQLNALSDTAGVLSTVTATSSDSGVLTATALPGTALGSHTIVVNSLAATGSSYSTAVASSSTTLAAGSFDLTANGKTTTISYGSSSVTTLAQLAASINSQSLGVTANVVTDASGARLSLAAQSSGSAADFSIANVSGLSFTHVNGADASLTVDGVPITSASNTVTGAVNGLTLNLQSSSPGTPINLTLTPDTTNITTEINNFVYAYNQLITDVNSQFSFNSSTGTSGTLSGDSVVRGLQSSLLSTANYSDSKSSISSLAALGISTNKDGTLTLDSSTLADAISNNFSGVQSFFQGAAQNGFASALNGALNVYTDPSEGAFTVDLSSLSSENQDLSNQISSFEVYIASEQTRLTNEYNQADIALQQLPQQIKQVQTLLGENNSSSNG